MTATAERRGQVAVLARADRYYGRNRDRFAAPGAARGAVGRPTGRRSAEGLNWRAALLLVARPQQRETIGYDVRMEESPSEPQPFKVADLLIIAALVSFGLAVFPLPFCMEPLLGAVFGAAIGLVTRNVLGAAATGFIAGILVAVIHFLQAWEGMNA